MAAAVAAAVAAAAPLIGCEGNPGHSGCMGEVGERREVGERGESRSVCWVYISSGESRRAWHTGCPLSNHISPPPLLFPFTPLPCLTLPHPASPPNPPQCTSAISGYS